MKKELSYILCDLDPKVKVIGKKAGICDGVPSTAALVFFKFHCKLRELPNVSSVIFDIFLANCLCSVKPV